MSKTKSVRRRGLGVSVFLGAMWVFATHCGAQDWITPQSCAISGEMATAATMPSAGGISGVAKAKDIANGTGRLWRVTSPDGARSYLWGTMHSSDRLILDLPDEVTKAVGQASALVLEYLPGAQSRVELEERALQAGVWIAPDDAAYDHGYLDARLRPWVEDRVAAMTGDQAALLKLTDAGLASLLLSDPCEDFAAGVLPIQDYRLYLSAYEAGVPVKGLESWDAFLVEMSQHDRQKTARAISEIYGTYLNPADFTAARAASFGLYRQGRIGEMMASNQIYLRDFYGKKKAAELSALADGYMIVERNHTFLRAMRKFLDAGNAVIAVGVFHLPGDDGLIEGLRRAGYRVVRQPVEGEAE